MAMSVKNIPISELFINTENFRYDEVPNQREAIDVMIEDQKDRLYELAKDIAKNGLNPNDKIAVVYTGLEKEHPLVLEGNRRVLALKLLDNPNLIENHSGLKKKFVKLRSDASTTIPHEIELNVFDDPAEAHKWIKLKHTGDNKGAGTIGWNAVQKDRYIEKIEKKSSISLQTINLLQSSPDVPEDLKKKLKNNPKITNFGRMLEDPDVRKFFGVEFKEGKLISSIPQKEVVKGLTQLANDLLDPEFTVGQIYSKEDRMEYLDSFDPEKKPDTTLVAPEIWEAPMGAQTKKVDPKPKSVPTERKVLIPKNCAMKISNTKCNHIFAELKKLDMTKFPHATSVLMRVFIELSCDSYIDAYNPAINTKRKGNPSLKEKVLGISDDMIARGFTTKNVCKGIHTGVCDPNSTLSTDTFNSYVHNKHFSPTIDYLTKAWDNIQDFMTDMWDNTP